MTLYELVKQYGGLDIVDNIYYWVNYFDFSDDNCDDYDRCMVEMAKRIEVVKVNHNLVTTCKITQFLLDNEDVITEFIDSFYDDEYKPQEEIEAESEEFYDYYIDLFTTLINGCWSDNKYKWLADRLEKENGKKIQYRG